MAVKNCDPVLKKGLTWCVVYYVGVGAERKRVRRSRTNAGIDLNSIADLAERERVGQELLEQIRKQVEPPETRREQTPFVEALPVAVGLKSSTKEKSQATYQQVADWVIKFWELKGWKRMRCDEVTFDHVQAYFDYLILDRKLGNTTHNTRKGVLRSLVSELVARGYLKENLVAKVKSRPRQDPTRRPFTDAEKMVVLRYLSENDRPLYVAALMLGYLAIRPREIRDLQVRNIDLKRWVINMPGAQSKNNRNSVVTIPTELCGVFEALGLDGVPGHYYLFGGGRGNGRHNAKLKPAPARIGEHTLSEKFRKVLRLLHASGALPDIEGLQFYSLKDSLALYLLEQGVDIDTARDHFRHSSLEMFQRYLKRLGGVKESIRGLKVELP